MGAFVTCNAELYRIQTTYLQVKAGPSGCPTAEQRLAAVASPDTILPGGVTDSLGILFAPLF